MWIICEKIRKLWWNDDNFDENLYNDDKRRRIGVCMGVVECAWAPLDIL